MELTHRTVGNISIVSLSSRLIRNQVTQIRKQLLDLVKEECPYLIIELTQLSHADVHGLSIFLSALKTAQRYGGDVVLLNPTDHIRFLIELTRLQHTFSIYMDETACVTAIQQLWLNSESHLTDCHK